MAKKQQFVTHIDTNRFTSEGLGSHARGSIYPLLKIALDTSLTPIFDSNLFASNAKHNYQDFNLEELLDVEKRPKNIVSLRVNTWHDVLYGDCFGKSKSLVKTIQQMQLPDKCVVELRGPLRYINPNRKVLDWLHQHAKIDSNDVDVAVHMRRGDMDEKLNSIDGFLQSMKLVSHLRMKVFTQKNIGNSEIARLRDTFPDCKISTNGTVLQDLTNMASAKVFIASASHFSTFAAYLSSKDTIIIINEGNSHFDTLKDLRGNVYLNSDPKLKQILKIF